MFTRVWAVLASLLLMIGTALGATGGGAPPSKDEVIAQVAKAVEFYRTNGRQHALAAFNSRSGPFAKGMDYVDVHDLTGICVAHPLSPDIVGTNRLDVADMHGKKFILEIVNAAKSQTSGWVTYMRENPNTGKVEHKIAYWQVQDGLIFKAGTYE
jgi:polar amino acid transport system substrate-binding protein